MASELSTYAGALYGDVWFFLARSKADAGRRLYPILPAHLQSGTSANALARYVAPLCWCPRANRLWFKMTVADRPRVIHPRRVAAELWGGIRKLTAASLDPHNYYGDDLATAEVTEAVFERHPGLGCALVNAASRVTIDRSAVTGNDAAALRIAREIDRTGDFTSLPILADALEEAGCGSSLLLEHCRKTGAHVPGCWAVTLVLRKGVAS
jgi:hypothetical protein